MSALNIGKRKCKNNRNGYKHVLENNKHYQILDIQDSIFAGSYYVTVKGEEESTPTCHLERFDITKEEAVAYVKEKYG